VHIIALAVFTDDENYAVYADLTETQRRAAIDTSGHCTVAIKWVNDDIYMGHDTWYDRSLQASSRSTSAGFAGVAEMMLWLLLAMYRTDYADSLRIFKHYSFGFTDTAIVATHSSFSSYPAFVQVNNNIVNTHDTAHSASLHSDIPSY
jgi:hypothetical protein